LSSPRVAVFDDDDDEVEEMTRWEWLAASALFGWECPAAWKRVSRLAHVVAVDPFFDLVAMSCVVANILLMSLDHADMEPGMAAMMNHCNYVRLTGCILFSPDDV